MLSSIVRSRPKTNEAYWVFVKDYFRDLATRKSGKVIFDKTSNKFDVSAKDALLKLATPADSGLYLGTKPKQEFVYSNLLRVAPLPQYYYVAQTDYRTAGELFARLHEITLNVRGEWLLVNKTLMSFHDLRDHPWTEVCEMGTCEEFETQEWAVTEDPAPSVSTSLRQV